MPISKAAGTGITGRKRLGTEPKESPKPRAVVHEDNSLELSDVEYKPLSWFAEDPENSKDFDKAKDSQPNYWRDLKQDVKAVGILTPLLATTEGHLLQGHSRLRIAKELEAEGHYLYPDLSGKARVPVRIVLDTMDIVEIRNRRRLDNLLRFEIDPDTRLAMLIEIWPEVYLVDKQPGRPKDDNRDTVSFLSPAAIAEKLGTSERQEKRNRHIAKKAQDIAKNEGQEKIAVEHIAAARAQVNASRSEKELTVKKIVTDIKKLQVKIHKRISKSSNPGELASLQDIADTLAKIIGQDVADE